MGERAAAMSAHWRGTIVTRRGVSAACRVCRAQACRAGGRADAGLRPCERDGNASGALAAPKREPVTRTPTAA